MAKFNCSQCHELKESENQIIALAISKNSKILDEEHFCSMRCACIGILSIIKDNAKISSTWKPIIDQLQIELLNEEEQKEQNDATN